MTVNQSQIYNAGTAAQWRRIVFGDSDETITIPSTVNFTGSVTIPAVVGSLTFTEQIKSATAFATPGALAATAAHFFASTVSGAVMMGYGTTSDVTLMNRAGTAVLLVAPNAVRAGIGALSNTAGFNIETTTTAAGGAARNVRVVGTLIAAANNDAMTGAFMASVSTPGAFTGLIRTGLWLAAYSVAAFTSPGNPRGMFIDAIAGTGASEASSIEITPPTSATTNYLLRHTTAATFNILASGALTTAASLTFGTLLASTTALATPSALAATALNVLASTVSGGTLMGYGTTSDVTLKNRAGTDVFMVAPNEVRASIGAHAGTAVFNIQASITASGAAARGIRAVNTLVAAANGDTLTGIFVAPTHTPGAFTGLVTSGMTFVGYSVAGFTTPSTATMLDIGAVTGAAGMNTFGLRIAPPTGGDNNYLISHSTVATFNVTSAGLITTASNVVAGAAASYSWTGRSILTSTADGRVSLTNAAASAGIGFDFATDGTVKVNTRTHSGYGTIDAGAYYVGGVAGASASGAAVTSITVVAGIVTAITVA